MSTTHTQLETSTCRPYLARFCIGKGLDIGFGGDPIKPDAVTLDKNPDLYPEIYCDAVKLPASDGAYDYVYSSHCLEDFEDTTAVIKEWLRVIKPGGNLVLFLPDQSAYEAHCKAHKVQPNSDHKHPQFGTLYVMSCLYQAGGNQVIYYEFPCSYNPYSFAMVVKKL